MKKIITTSLLLLCVATLFSQNRFTAAVAKGLVLMDSATTGAEHLAAANYFERIANAEPAQWLAQYYTALSLIFVGYDDTKDAETKDLVYDKAMTFADKAEKLQPGNSDIYALKGYITFMQMAVAPQARAMAMIPASNALIEKAIEADGENPRALLMKGQNLFYTPEAFGGGRGKAAEVLKMAAAKFETQVVTGIEPSWGKRRCTTLLAQCK